MHWEESGKVTVYHDNNVITLNKDSEYITRVSAKDKGGVITFTSSPGTYTLKYNKAGKIIESDFDFLKHTVDKECNTKIIYNNLFDYFLF